MPGAATRTVHPLAALSLAGIAYATQQMGLLPVLPQVRDTFGVSVAWAAWTISAFLLASAIATPALGKLGDLHGQRPTLLAVLGISLVGTVVAAIAPTMPVFIAGRLLQGVGAATFALGFAAARDLAPAGRAPAWIALLGAAFSLGGGGALALSGFVVDAVSWRWLLWLGVPLHLVAIAAVVAAIPASPARTRRRLDLAGAALLAAGVAAILVALTESASWGRGSAQTLGVLAAGVALLVAWGRFETRVEDPLVDAGMLARPGVVRGNAVSSTMGFVTFGSLAVLPVMVQASPFAYGSAAIGLLLSLSTLPIVLSAPITGHLAARTSAAALAAGGLAGLALAMLLLAAAPGSELALWTAMGVLGLALGVTFTTATVLVVEGVDSGDTAISASLATVTRLLGGVLGAQLAATLVAGGAGFSLVYLLAALAVLPALWIVLSRPAVEGAPAPVQGASH